ncbi:hypothetical protein YPPY94_0252, partial [Yersinia pestis PY-94]
MAKKIT